MNGPARSQDVIAELYRHCPDHQLPWLDELIITAGYRRRCASCAAAVPADHPCLACIASTDGAAVDAVTDAFAAYRTLPEAVWPIPVSADDHRPVRIGVSAAGGGTLGRAYGHNTWIYGVWLGCRLYRSGTDLHSGLPRTHHQMARFLADALADDPDLEASVATRLADWADHRPDGAEPDDGE